MDPAISLGSCHSIWGRVPMETSGAGAGLPRHLPFYGTLLRLNRRRSRWTGNSSCSRGRLSVQREAVFVRQEGSPTQRKPLSRKAEMLSDLTRSLPVLWEAALVEREAFLLKGKALPPNEKPFLFSKKALPFNEKPFLFSKKAIPFNGSPLP